MSYFGRESIYLIVIALMVVGDHQYGSGLAVQFAQAVNDAVSKYVSSNTMIYVVCVLALLCFATHLYLKKMDENIVRLSCTPKLSPQEFEIHTKETTLKKLKELSDSEEYRAYMRSFAERVSEQPTEPARHSNSMRMSEAEGRNSRSNYNSNSTPLNNN